MQARNANHIAEDALHALSSADAPLWCKKGFKPIAEADSSCFEATSEVRQERGSGLTRDCGCDSALAIKVQVRRCIHAALFGGNEVRET